MLIQKLESQGLAHFSYFVADGHEAALVDPRRDPEAYLDLASKTQARIRYILETHLNEDCVTGSTALRQATGAEILHSRSRQHCYGTPIGEAHEIGVGRLRLRAIETPGHTLESLSFSLVDSSAGDAAVALFSGDALFSGGVGRTDLLGDERTQELAGRLYETLHEKILPLGDGVVLFPAHGSGSVCGSGISDRDVSSLGYERLSNPFLRKDREKFIRAKVAEHPLQPPYFRRMEEWNSRGSAPVYERLPVVAPLSPGEFADALESGRTIVDCRMPQAFAGGHVPGSYNIWIDGIAGYLGWIVKPGTRLVLVLPERVPAEAVTRQLLRIGYDEIDGYLAGGFEAWQNSGREMAFFGTVGTGEVRSLRNLAEVEILDVRQPDEWERGSIRGARKIFVGDLESRLGEIPRGKFLVTMCSVGHRGSIAASILARNGFNRVANYLGGYRAWNA